MVDRTKNKLITHFKTHGVVHLIWLVSILIGIVIALLSVRLGTDGSVKDILNFAVALSSLLLALVAIVQAIVSSGAMSDTIGEVHRAVASIALPAEQVSKAAAVIGSYSQDLNEKTTNIQTSIAEMRELGVGRVVENSVPLQTTFNEAMLDGAAVITKVFLYAVVVSYEEKIPLRALFPGGNESESSFLHDAMRSMLALLIDSGAIGIKSSREYEKAMVSDLGALSWLPSKRNELLLRKAGGSQETLTRLIAEIDTLAGHIEVELES